MSDTLLNSPIVEAVLDLECDMPPALDLGALESASLAVYGDRYPVVRKQIVQAHASEGHVDALPTLSYRRGIQALQFLVADEKQLLQVRAQGFSFNRLAPYTSLDEYLPEIERTWRLFVDLAAPLQVRLIRLRNINRILLPPGAADGAKVGRYLQIPWRLPMQERLTFGSFLHHFAAIDAATGHRVRVAVGSQPEEKGGALPVIFDIKTFADGIIEPLDWSAILAKIQSLRDLKNDVFRSILTDECLKLFQE